jgi:hypothetical protein
VPWRLDILKVKGENADDYAISRVSSCVYQTCQFGDFQKLSSRMFSFILTIVGLYSDDSGSAPASMRMSSTILLLASRAYNSY